MKAHDEVAKNTISLARAAIKQYEVDNRAELDDARYYRHFNQTGKNEKRCPL